MKRSIAAAILTFAIVAFANVATSAETVPLTSLDLSKMRQGWGKPQIDRSIREKPLSIGGRIFDHGVGTHASSTLWVDLDGGAERFQASVGVDDNAAGNATLEFRIVGDGKRLFDSGVMKPGDAAQEVDVDLKGVKSLLLLVVDGGDGIGFDHANWAEARFAVTGEKPRAVDGPAEERTVLTPRPPAAPRHQPAPGDRLPARQSVPLPHPDDRRAAHPLHRRGPARRPDARRRPGIILGTAPAQGEYRVTLKARNAHGEDARTLKIVAGDTLALTPTMGWNHWYAHYDRITDAMMREAADVMVSSGMADVGLPVREHRRLLDERPEERRSAARRPAPRRAREHRPQPALPRHEGPDRLHPRQGPARPASTPRPAR